MLVKEQELPFAPHSIRKSEDIYKLLAPLAAGLPVEAFWVVALNSAHEVIGVSKLFQGTVTQSLVGPREVFQYLFLANAAAFAVGHNHPSGQTFPSHQDKEVTKGLRQIGASLCLPLLDHVILAGDRYFSFRQEGLL